MTRHTRWLLTYLALLVALLLVFALVVVTLLSESLVPSMVIEPCRDLRIFICRRITVRS